MRCAGFGIYSHPHRTFNISEEEYEVLFALRQRSGRRRVCMPRLRLQNWRQERKFAFGHEHCRLRTGIFDARYRTYPEHCGAQQRKTRRRRKERALFKGGHNNFGVLVCAGAHHYYCGRSLLYRNVNLYVLRNISIRRPFSLRKRPLFVADNVVKKTALALSQAFNG